MAQFSHLGITTAIKISVAQALTNGVTSYSNIYEAKVWGGFAALEIVAMTATATISQQCSVDGTNWYDPVDNTGAALGLVSTASTGAKYVEFAPVVTKYVRLKYIASGNGTVTSNLVIVE